MPEMKRKKPLRDIMNRYELMQLLKAAKLQKHKIAFALAYGSGLRIKELINVKIQDIDLVRKTVHVRMEKVDMIDLYPSVMILSGDILNICLHMIS